jgi:hypothetical protein
VVQESWVSSFSPTTEQQELFLPAAMRAALPLHKSEYLPTSKNNLLDNRELSL